MAKKADLQRWEDMNPLEVRNTYTKAEAVVFRDLANLIEDKVGKDLWWYWDLGKRLAVAIKDAKANKKHYGSNFIPRIARGLGYETGQMLANCVRMVDVWPTKKEFTALLKLRGEADNRLLWTHICHLATVSDQKTRNQLSIATLSNCWTARELFARTKNENPRDNPNAGPTLKIPDNPGRCMTHMQSMSSQWVRQFDQAWTGSQFDLAVELSRVPNEQITPGLIKDMKATLKAVTTLEKRTQKAEKLLTDAIEKANKKLSGDSVAKKRGRTVKA
jgi:hypothetical protein